MADLDRKRRFAARLQKYLPVAAEMKDVRSIIALARLVMALNSWEVSPSKDDQPDPQTPAPDMSRLLDSLGTQGETHGA